MRHLRPVVHPSWLHTDFPPVPSLPEASPTPAGGKLLVGAAACVHSKPSSSAAPTNLSWFTVLRERLGASETAAPALAVCVGLALSPVDGMAESVTR